MSSSLSNSRAVNHRRIPQALTILTCHITATPDLLLHAPPPSHTHTYHIFCPSLPQLSIKGIYAKAIIFRRDPKCSPTQTQLFTTYCPSFLPRKSDELSDTALAPERQSLFSLRDFVIFGPLLFSFSALGKV